jgi:hypothetical protein
MNPCRVVEDADVCSPGQKVMSHRGLSGDRDPTGGTPRTCLSIRRFRRVAGGCRTWLDVP